ncbi:MAG: T9SS type A sorting domain-containing protein [Hymenobacter sp.]|nr:MAG: T9SS type A sorting domain-containing protein [Hymenobacter sp.]
MNMLTRLFNRLLPTTVCVVIVVFTVTDVRAQTTTTTWTGAVSANYTTPGNWSPASVPSATDNVIIPVTSRAPVLSALGRGFNVTIANGTSLTVTAGATLNIGGNLINNGTFGGDGELATVGTTSTSQILDGTGGLINLGNLTIGAAGASLQSPMNIARRLFLTGSLTTTTGNTLTLLSTVDVTAFVVNNGGIVNGTVTVQRAIDGSINAGLGYRHYSSPVANSTIADLAAPGFTPNVAAGAAYNASNTPRATVPFPTVFEYDQARVANGAIVYNPPIDRGYQVPNPTLGLAAPLEVAHGYAVNISSTSLVDFVGTLNNGTYSRQLARNAAGSTDDASAGWHLVGNPYPAPMDFAVLAPPPTGASTNLVGIDAAIYVVQSTSQYGNTYRTYMSNINAVNPVAPVGQGFFVHVTTPGTTGTITFQNAQRLTSSDNTTFQRTAAITHPQLELTLQSVATPALTDLAIVHFQSGSTSGVDPRYDALKLANGTGLNLSTLMGSGESLAIDGRPLPTGQLTVPLQVFIPVSGDYTLQASQLRNMSGLYSYLRDKQTGAFIDLAQQASYTFNLNAYNTTPRFELVFSPQRVLATAPAALTQQVSLYPSPTKELAFLELPASLGNQALTATLVDALGRNVRTISLPAQGTAAHQLRLNGLSTGVYAMQLRTEAGVVVKRLVIE